MLNDWNKSIVFVFVSVFGTSDHPESARWRSASAPACRPGVVAGNRRKCQFTPRTSRLLLLLTLIADKGDHLCSVGSNPGLSVARQQPIPLVTAPSSVDVCYRFGRLTRGKATVEIMMQLNMDLEDVGLQRKLGLFK